MDFSIAFRVARNATRSGYSLRSDSPKWTILKDANSRVILRRCRFTANVAAPMLNYRSVPKIAILLVAFGASLLAADPTAIPLADGTLLVDGDFVQFDQDLNHYSPTLTYTIIN